MEDRLNPQIGARLKLSALHNGLCDKSDRACVYGHDYGRRISHPHHDFVFPAEHRCPTARRTYLTFNAPVGSFRVRYSRARAIPHRPARVI